VNIFLISQDFHDKAAYFSTFKDIVQISAEVGGLKTF